MLVKRPPTIRYFHYNLLNHNIIEIKVYVKSWTIFSCELESSLRNGNVRLSVRLSVRPSVRPRLGLPRISIWNVYSEFCEPDIQFEHLLHQIVQEDFGGQSCLDWKCSTSLRLAPWCGWIDLSAYMPPKSDDMVFLRLFLSGISFPGVLIE